MWYSKRRRAQNDQDFETWIEGGVCPTLNAFDNTGDSRATVIVFAPGPMVRLGGNIWEGIVPTLRAEGKRGDAEPHILIIDGTRVDDVRVYEGPVQTLKERMGTGGNNVPIIAFDGYNQSVTENIYRALRIGIDSGDCIAIPIQEENNMTTDINGSEIAATLRGFGHGWQGQQNSTHSVAVTEDQEETIMQVRRLTPVECERLMGWPDDHTRWRADGKEQADTNRYKQCGNGVATPVAKWIAHHIRALL